MTTWKRSIVMWRSCDDMEEIDSDVEVVRRHGRDRVMWRSCDDMEEIDSAVDVV